MKKFYIMGMVAAALLPPAVQSRTVYGYQAWEFGVEHAWRGPVSFDSDRPGTMRRIADCSDMSIVYGGYYYNYHWYGQAIVKGTQSSVEGLYEIDMTTGERKLLVKGGTKMIDLTYDYSRDKVWGIRTGNSVLCEYLPTTGSYESKGTFKCGGDAVNMLAIAAALDGTIYAVGSNDNLYTVNADDASCTLVGALGVDAGFDQTMAFDYHTGTLYWCNNADYTFYSIDTATGKATKIGAMGPDGVSSMASLFIPYINVAVGAPDRVTAIAGRGGASDISLTWTNPSITAQGDPLAAYSGVKIIRDGEQLAILPMSPENIGKAASYDDVAVEPGKDYEYRIVPFNEAGDGGVDADALTVRAGADIPGKVGNLKAQPGDGSAILTWTAPEHGAAHGVFDPAGITGYVVKRDNRTVATVAADVLTYEDKTSFGTYTYSVAAVNEQGTGAASTVADVQVKPADWIVMHNGEETLADGVEYKFYDEGGPSGNYTNSSNYQLVLTPANPNGVVSLSFTKLAIDTYYDNIAIYHGRGTDGEKVGQFNGNTVPSELEHIESKAKDGTLTVTFDSDIMDAGAGWEAVAKVNVLKSVDLAATSLRIPSQTVANAETEAVVTVKNGGISSAEGYAVTLLAGDVKIAEIEGPAIESRGVADVVVPYTPTAEGALTLTARVVIAGDEDPTNDLTPAMSQAVLPAGTSFVEILTPTESQSKIAVVPASFMAYESLSEVLYNKADISDAVGGEILSVTYPLLESSKSYKEVPFVMYIGSTADKDLTNAIPADKLTKVFDGKVDITSGDGEITLVLDKPYSYKGDNLVIMLHKLDSPTNLSGINFRGCYGYATVCDGSHTGCTLFTSRWNDDDPALDPNASSIGYGTNNMRPDIILAVKSAGGGTIDINVDTDADAPVIYYDLRGIRVSADRLTPGTYIRIQGTKATKILIN